MWKLNIPTGYKQYSPFKRLPQTGHFWKPARLAGEDLGLIAPCRFLQPRRQGEGQVPGGALGKASTWGKRGKMDVAMEIFNFQTSFMEITPIFDDM